MSNAGKYDYNRFGSKGQRVGQAVVDILSQEQPEQTVEDILENYGHQYAKEINDCIEENKHKYTSPFYVFVLTNKEPWAVNIVRNWFIARQTPPHATQMMAAYPHHTKTLYIVNANRGDIKLVWTLPGYGECISILKTPLTFNEKLVKDIVKCFDGELDKDKYNINDLPA